MQEFLDQIALSRRWGISHRTLERWRWLSMGPPFLKLGGGRVRYRVADIVAYEAACRRNGKSALNSDGSPQQIAGGKHHG